MKVVTFGELMVRLQPFNYERFVQANNLEFTFGGGEANVAVSLANYGMDAVYVTKLPAHAIGQAAVDSLRYFGVDTSMIIRGGENVYPLEVENFLDWLNNFGEDNNIKFTVTISADESLASDGVKKYF